MWFQSRKPYPFVSNPIPPDETPSDTEAALLYLKTLFPAERFDPRLPAIVMKHQVYSVIHDKTTADRELVSCGRTVGVGVDFSHLRKLLIIVNLMSLVVLTL